MKYIGYLTRDLQLATKYVGVQMNVFDYLGDKASSNLALERYQHIMQDFFEMYVQNKEYKNNPYAAPLLAPDLSNQPATLVITAEHDILKDEGMAYGIRLRESGNHVSIHCIKNALHGFFSLPWISGHAKESYKIINRFLMGNEPKESIELRN